MRKSVASVAVSTVVLACVHGLWAQKKASEADQWRPGKGAWHQACDQDVARLCPGLHQRKEITACLDKNTDKLSEACRNIRAQEERRWKEEQRKKRKKGP